MADSFRVRIPIGLALIVGISSLFFLDHHTGHGYGVIAVTTLAAGLGLREYARLAGSVGPIPARSLILAGMAYIAVKGLAYELDPRLHLLLAPLVILFAYAVFFSCLQGAPSRERLQGLCATALGFFYVPFLGGFVLDVRFLPDVGEPAVFYIIAIAKGTDICAYFSGKLLGRTKVVPSVSPGKTVAGFVGALAGGVAITSVFVLATSMGDLIALPLAVGVGIVMGLIVISGDLIESFIKRSAEVKDSADMLPQFGGVLDIIDTILIAAPPTCFILVASAHLRAA